MPEVTISDLRQVRDGAIRKFIHIPTRCRMAGMLHDLNDDEKRVLAFVDATLTMLSRLGVDVSAVQGPAVHTVVQEVIEGHG
jgi:hypothetical protein